MMTPAERDKTVLAAMEQKARATYVIRNYVHNSGHGPNLTTAQVLQSCKRLEKAGLIQRRPSNYLVMLSWALPSQEAQS